MASQRRLLYVVLGSLTLLVALLVADGVTGRGREKAVFDLMGHLRRGMSRDEVIKLVNRSDTSFLRLHETDDRLVATASTGLGRGCILTMEFQDKKLSSARIRGEDGPTDVLKGAPPDI